MKTLVPVATGKLPCRMTAVAIAFSVMLTCVVGTADADIVTYGFLTVDGTGLDGTGESDASRISRTTDAEGERSLYATDSLLSYYYELDGHLAEYTSYGGIRSRDGNIGAYATTGRTGQASAAVFWTDTLQLLPPSANSPEIDTLLFTFQIRGLLETTASDGGSSDAEIAVDINDYRFTRDIQSQSVQDAEGNWTGEAAELLINTRIIRSINVTDGMADISYNLGLFSTAFRGSAVSDFFGTMEMTSITFADGSTPESSGYTIEFRSGMSSPNATAVPEPNLLAVFGFGTLICIVVGFHKRASIPDAARMQSIDNPALRPEVLP